MSAPNLAANAAKTVVAEAAEPLFTAKSLVKNMFLAGGITSFGDFLCQGLEAYTDANKKIETQITSYHQAHPDLSLEAIEQMPQFTKASYLPTLFNGDWKLNKSRFLSVAGFGFCFFGPVGGIWYPALDRIMLNKFAHYPRGSVKFVLTKALLEQVFLGPVYTAAFFPFTTLGEGKGWEDLKAKLKQDYLQTLILDEACWLMLAPLLYGVTPVKYQLAFASCLASAEAMVLSYIAHNSFSAVPVLGPIADKFFTPESDKQSV